MQNIALPKKIEFKRGDKKNEGKIIVEPCYPGYGVTLGNALRRVLLSSLPGAAVVGVKIKGVDHEFSAKEHLKEDIMEIILNLKKLRIRVHGDETLKLNLNVHGEKEVTAANIEKNAQVEIINPELTIAHITDMAGKLEMEIFVSRGRGYETVESREGEKKEIGYIEIDSIFTPILSVGVDVENVRVGKMTDWDRLVLDVLTDGTIDFEEAFNETVKILIEQFGSLLNIQVEAEKEIVLEKEKSEDKEMVEEKKEASEEAGGEVKKKRGRPKKTEQ